MDDSKITDGGVPPESELEKSAAMPALLLSGRRFTPSPLPSVTTRSTAMESASPSKRWNSLPRFIPASPVCLITA